MLEQKYHKLINMLERDDFCSAEVKKIYGTKYSRAKLDHKNRLLFTFVTYQKQRFILILELIHNHAYDRSRFLRNHQQFADEKTFALDNLADLSFEGLPYLNPLHPNINVLNRLISFDNERELYYADNYTNEAQEIDYRQLSRIYRKHKKSGIKASRFRAI